MCTMTMKCKVLYRPNSSRDTQRIALQMYVRIRVRAWFAIKYNLEINIVHRKRQVFYQLYSKNTFHIIGVWLFIIFTCLSFRLLRMY